jgi:DNA-binding protein HU-beta
MYKEEFISYLAKKNRRPKSHYREAISEILTGIKEKLAEGKELQLLGFGTFYTRVHKGGKGLNFKTKQKVEYKALRQAAFRPGALLKQAVRRKKGLFGH